MKKDKLTDMHLSAYLPYALTVKTGNVIDIMVGLDAMDGIVTTLNNGNRLIQHVKPLLLPTTALKGNTIYKGKPAAYSNFIGKYEIDEIILGRKEAIDLPYWEFEYLLMFHIDAFDLIGKGWALNKLDYVQTS